MINDKPRTKKLGDWGEEKAIALLKRAGFCEVKNLNGEKNNQLFCDIYAERGGERYLVSVKTRNRYEVNAKGKKILNSRYNWHIRRRENDLSALMQQYNAKLAWIGIAVIPEKQTFSAFFITAEHIRKTGKQFAILMTPRHTEIYERLTRPFDALEEFDPSIDANWSNGAFLAR